MNRYIYESEEREDDTNELIGFPRTEAVKYKLGEFQFYAYCPIRIDDVLYLRELQMRRISFLKHN